MGRHSRRDSYSSSDSGDYGGRPIQIVKTYSPDRHSSHHHIHRSRNHSPDINVYNTLHNLNVPDQRGRIRSSSTGGYAQPNIKIYTNERSPSRERRRPRSRSGSRGRGRRDYEYEEMRRKVREIEEKEKAERLVAQMEIDKEKREKERKRLIEEAKFKEEEDKRKEKERRERYVADWKREEAEKKEKEKKEKEEFDKKFEARFRETFLSQGYSPESVEAMLKKKRDKEKHDSMELVIRERARKVDAIDLSRPTYIKVHRRYLHPNTLDVYGLPWEWDTKDTEYIIIKRYIDHTLQEELFEHTRKLSERKLLTYDYSPSPVVKETRLRPNDGLGEGTYIVRRKSVGRGGRDRSRSRVRSVAGFFAT